MIRTEEEMRSAMRQCLSREEAQQLFRSEVAAMIHDYGSLDELQARKILLGNIGFVLSRMDDVDDGRTKELFEDILPQRKAPGAVRSPAMEASA